MAVMAGTTTGTVPGRRLTRTTARDGLERLAVGTAVGGAAGMLIGGIAGRLAMFLLRLTSDSSLTGVSTDDDFRIGSFTADTIFLILVTTVLGAALGGAYVGARRWLPRGHRPLVTAVTVGAIGGAAIIEPGGVDFTLLDPLWLAVTLFVALPAAFGAALAWGVEGLLPWVSGRHPHIVILLLALLPAAVLPPTAALLVAGAVGWVALRRWPAAGRLWWSASVTAVGRAVAVAGIAFAGVVLARDVAEIL
jgi:hypothetical protein